MVAGALEIFDTVASCAGMADGRLDGLASRGPKIYFELPLKSLAPEVADFHLKTESFRDAQKSAVRPHSALTAAR